MESILQVPFSVDVPHGSGVVQGRGNVRQDEERRAPGHSADSKAPGGPNSIETFWLEFWLEKPLEFWLEIPYTKKMFKNG